MSISVESVFQGVLVAHGRGGAGCLRMTAVSNCNLKKFARTPCDPAPINSKIAGMQRINDVF
jgi:hypothetical protein